MYGLTPVVCFGDSVLAVVGDDAAKMGCCDADYGVHEERCLNFLVSIRRMFLD